MTVHIHYTVYIVGQNVIMASRLKSTYGVEWTLNSILNVIKKHFFPPGLLVADTPNMRLLLI